MPEDFFRRIQSTIKPEWKKGFIATFIIGVLTHLVVFTQYLPNHDGLINIHTDQLKFGLGRFFLGPAGWVGSSFDLSLINGLLSVLYLSLLTVVLIELFDLKKSLSIYMLGGILVTFPTITSTFAYMFTSDPYMLGYLMTAFAILLTKKYKWGFLAGGILFYLAVGIYQVNLPFALAFITLTVIHDLMNEERKFPVIFMQLFKQFLTVASGMGLYAVTYFLYRRFSSDISEYQGLDSIGEQSSSVISLLREIKNQFQNFFAGGFFNASPVTFFEIMNAAVLALLALYLINFLFKRNLLRVGLIAVGIILIPVFTYILYFVSPGVIYHALMLMGATALYIVLILFYEQSKIEKTLSWVTAIVLTLTILNFAIIANISYLHLQLRYDKTLSFANRVLAQVETHEEYSPDMELAVVGRYNLSSSIGSYVIPDKLPPLTGIIGETILAQPYHYTYYFNTMLGVSHRYANAEKITEIKETEAYQGMPIWPAPGSVEVVNEIMVIKFQDQ